MENERINLKQIRSISEILTVSAQFMRENFVPIMKTVLVPVMLPIIIGGVLLGFSMSSMYTNMASTMSNPGAYNPFSTFAGLMPAYLIIGIALGIFYIMCVSYIKHYANKEENITRSLLFDDVKKNIVRIIFGGILLGVIMMVGFMLCLLPGIYLSVVFAQIFIIVIVEGKDFFTSFSRAFVIIKGKWWNTFFLYFVTYIISIGLAFIVVIPMYVIMGVNMFSSLKEGNTEKAFESMSIMAWIMPLYVLLFLVINMLYTTISSFNYYSLVEEKEGFGEKDEINNIGQ